MIVSLDHLRAVKALSPHVLLHASFLLSSENQTLLEMPKGVGCRLWAE